MPPSGDGAHAPVFVISPARSGSTLLRLVIDSHPDLTCPPETGIGAVCEQLANTWAVLEGGGSADSRSRQRSLSVEAGREIRATVDLAFGRLLARSGKRRWCDKSINNLQHLELLAQLWPGAQFLCLYRSCPDVIKSVIDACPWGVSGYGLDRYVTQYPGNSVAAVAGYWLASTERMLSFSRAAAARCHRVRYEDLVTEPATVLAAVFDFLEVAQAPGIERRCFELPHERSGPGDHKVWATSAIHAGSVGSGADVPLEAIPPRMLERIGQLHAELNYPRPGSRPVAGSTGAVDVSLARPEAALVRL